MATQTFSYRVQAKPSHTRAITVRDISFGDGYTQSTGEGVNSLTESWSITWIGSKSDCDAIMTFLDSLGGYQSFFWTSPRGLIGLYRCKDHSDTDLSNDFFQITGTFEKRYAS
jgi:phage-related protein